MFNRNKIKILESENKELKKQFLTLTDNYNEYARRMSEESRIRDIEYNNLQKKLLNILSKNKKLEEIKMENHINELIEFKMNKFSGFTKTEDVLKSNRHFYRAQQARRRKYLKHLK